MKNIFHVSGPALKSSRAAQKGLTQKDVAKAIGITREAYANWEGRESVEVNSDQLKALKSVLKVHEDVITIGSHGTKKGGDDILDHPLIQSYRREIESLNEIIKLQKEKIKLLGGD